MTAPERVTFADVAHLAAAAARERVSVKESRNTEWYAVRTDGRIVAIGALYLKPNGSGRLKALYTLPDERGRGHGTAIARVLIDSAAEHGCGAVEVLTVSPTFWDGLGFARVGTYRPGVTRVVRRL